MGATKSHNSQQSQATSQQTLDPQIMSALQNNLETAKNTVAQAKYTPLSGSLIGQYEDPYTKDVTDTTMKGIAEQNQEQLAQNGLAQSASGDYDNNRSGVQNAETNRMFSQTAAQTLAQLNQANYGQASQTAQTENTNRNNWPLVLQQLLNQSLGLMGNPVLGQSQSTGSGSGFSMGVTLPTPAS